MEHEAVIGPTWRESTPWWPPTPRAPEGAPNVVLVVLDDVGYAQLGCYGSDIETPNLDRLADEGLRLSRFHTTAMCSPTRACLLTGRNHHTCSMGRVADLAMGFPGYWGRVGRDVGFLPEILGTHGYASAAVGKWHLTPHEETHMAAPRDAWPCGRGFQRWYGFHGGETHQFVPSLFQDNHAVAPPRGPGDGYHLSEDLADRAVQYLGEIRSAAPDQPFLLYLATGACHSPHHAPPHWIEHYRGRFDAGWDAWRTATLARQEAMGLVPPGTELPPRPPWVPAWDDLDPLDQAPAARFMECYAAFLSHADEQVGRVVDFLDQLGELDDTIVMVVSDNGASAEGGALGSINDVRTWNGQAAGRRELRDRIDEIGSASVHNNYPWGWTMAGNTPFRRWKREVHQGGIADPCIVRWPRAVGRPGAVAHQFTHAIDVVPTILELIGVAAPDELGGIEQRPIAGTSFAYLLEDPDAPERHTTQHFEMLGSRGIYDAGWKAVTFKPMAAMYDDGLDPDAPFDDDPWELYHLATDPTECHDLAAEQPGRLAELVDLWWAEARRHDVLPLDNRPLAALMDPHHTVQDRDRQVFWPGGSVVPESAVVDLRNRSHRVTAHVDVAAGSSPSGVLLALGTVLGGWSLQVHDGRPRYVVNHLGKERYVIDAEAALGPGRHEVGVSFSSAGDLSGTAALLLDGEVVGQGAIPQVVPVRYSLTGGGVTCGWEQGPAVGEGYEAPFPFSGTLIKVVVEVAGDTQRDLEAELAAIMSEQ